MIMCQTLWTNKRNLLEESFGWLSPQHHLMGWALSCLKLNEHYNAVQLHTDSAGKAILIDQLGLPYTTIFTEYDNLDCQSYLWALPKLLTYAKQDQPFLHIDGDVMIWEPLDQTLLSQGLIAQNLERGTEYYRSRFEPLLNELKYLPPILKRNLTSRKMLAYNAGIIGGSNIDFFKRFVSQAIQFIKKNMGCVLNSNLNMIFEQLLFFSMAEKEKKDVACLKDQIFNDNRYEQEIFANFPSVEKLRYLHLIGPHKRDKKICDWLARYLRNVDEETFLRITNLFRKQHFFYSSKIKEVYPKIKPEGINRFKYRKSEDFLRSLNPNICISSNNLLNKHISISQNGLLKELFTYEKRIHRICLKFNKIDSFCLKQMEDDTIASALFFTMEQRERVSVVLRRNPYIEIIHSAFDWPMMQISEIGGLNIRCSDKKDIVIGVVPELFFSSYQEVTLDETCINIIVLTEEEISYQDLLKKASFLFVPSKSEKEYEDFCKLIFIKVSFLIQNRILFISDKCNIKGS